MNEKIGKVLQALRKNNMNAFYLPDSAAVCAAVRERLFDGCTISSGGSVSLKESGVWDILKDEKYCFYDRTRPGITPEEQEEVYRKTVGCDFYFCSTNALTEDGQLVNVDGNCNRISAMAFGPKKVVLIVGVNKIVPDLKAAFLRVKTDAAPKNTVRLNLDTPCHKLGHCVALEKTSDPDWTDGCQSPSRICVNYMITAKQRDPERITVLLCGEELGY